MKIRPFVWYIEKDFGWIRFGRVGGAFGPGLYWRYIDNDNITLSERQGVERTYVLFGKRWKLIPWTSSKQQAFACIFDSLIRYRPTDD